MTIIAGFPQNGFVVLGADAEEGDNYAKSSVRKIATIDEPDYKCLIGGSGHGDFIDLSVQETRSALKDVSIPITQDVLRLTIERVVTDIYNDRIDTLPSAEQREAQFDLLCALWTRESSQVQLVKVARMISLIRTNPEVIGKGSYLARYLIETLAPLGEVTTRHVERMCAYVLAKVKGHVKDCGGASQIIVLTADGTVKDVPNFVVSADEGSASLVMDRHVRFLFHWLDPIGWQWNLTKMDRVVDNVATLLKKELREHLAKQGIQPREEPKGR